MPRSERHLWFWRWLSILAASAGLLLSAFMLPITLRFAYAPANYGAFALLLFAIPVAVIGVAVSHPRPWVTWAVIPVGFVLLFPVGLIGMGAIGEATRSGKNSSFELIAELHTLAGTVRAYRTNGGPTTDFGIVLRRERDIIPGLRAVSVLASHYHADQAELKSVSANTVRLKIAPYGTEYPEIVEEFHL